MGGASPQKISEVPLVAMARGDKERRGRIAHRHPGPARRRPRAGLGAESSPGVRMHGLLVSRLDVPNFSSSWWLRVFGGLVLRSGSGRPQVAKLSGRPSRWIRFFSPALSRLTSS